MTVQPTLIQSVVRALELLDLVGSAGAPVPAKRLSRLTGLPLGTTYNLLRTLVHEGYLVRDPDGYLLGDHADRLGEPGVTGIGRSRGRQILRTVHADLHAAVYWAEFADGAIRIVDIVDSADTPRADLWVGLQDSAHATALGKAVLSALSADQRRAYLSEHRLVDLTPRTHTDRVLLESELAATGAVSVDREEYTLGTACVAVPIRTRLHTGAVANSVPAARLPAAIGRLTALTRAARLLELADSA